MSDRHFHLRLNCTYKDSENIVDDLNVEVLNEGDWEPLELGIRSPGFLLFIYGLFSCQHLYMRTNCAERDLVLQSASGELKVTADKTWSMKKVSASFDVILKSGKPLDDDINYIIERMGHCPVSTNTKESANLVSTVNFLN